MVCPWKIRVHAELKVGEKEQLQILRQYLQMRSMMHFEEAVDSLNENEKNIFLELACFFREENRNHLIY